MNIAQKPVEHIAVPPLQKPIACRQGAISALERSLVGLFHELDAHRDDGGLRRREDQHALGRRIVQPWPSHLDLLQLPQTVRTKSLDGAIFSRLGWIHPELAIEARPGEPQRPIQCESPICQPQIEIDTQRRALEGLQDIQVQRHRVLGDLLEELLAEFDLALPPQPLTGPALVPPEPGPAGDRRINTGRDLFIFVGQLDMRVEEPLHLVAQPRAFSPAATPDWSHAQPAHERRERGPQNQHAALGAHRLGANPGQQQPGEIPEGQAGLTHGRHDQGVGAVDALVLKLATRVGAGQGTQHHQPRHETEIGVRFTGSNQKVHLVKAGEVVASLRRIFPEHLHEPFPARDASPGSSQSSDGGQTGCMTQRFSAAS